jgi:hypothetical protein
MRISHNRAELPGMRKPDTEGRSEGVRAEQDSCVPVHGSLRVRVSGLED